MKKKIYSYSESLTLTLCKEIEYIKSRSKMINYSLKYCQNKLLSKRLKSELTKLDSYKLKIANISQSLFQKNQDNLSFEFFLEITRRSISFQQI